MNKYKATIRHLSLNVRGILENCPDSKIKKLFVDEETGRQLTPSEARGYLLDCLTEGKELLPMGKCEGFDYKTGCPGHATTI